MCVRVGVCTNARTCAHALSHIRLCHHMNRGDENPKSSPHPPGLHAPTGSWESLRGKQDTPEGIERGVSPLNSMWALTLCDLQVAPLMTLCLRGQILSCHPSHPNLQSGSMLPVDKDDRHTDHQQQLGAEEENC